MPIVIIDLSCEQGRRCQRGGRSFGLTFARREVVEVCRVFGRMGEQSLAVRSRLSRWWFVLPRLGHADEPCHVAPAQQRERWINGVQIMTFCVSNLRVSGKYRVGQTIRDSTCDKGSPLLMGEVDSAIDTLLPISVHSERLGRLPLEFYFLTVFLAVFFPSHSQSLVLCRFLATCHAWRFCFRLPMVEFQITWHDSPFSFSIDRADARWHVTNFVCFQLSCCCSWDLMAIAQWTESRIWDPSSIPVAMKSLSHQFHDQSQRSELYFGYRKVQFLNHMNSIRQLREINDD
jgi:hypothetical protein